MANRAELEQALKDGYTVDVNGLSIRNVRELPKDPADGPGIEGTVVRDAQGRLTREGMELAIRRGGSVLPPGGADPITDLDALPSEAELAAHDEKRSAQVRQALDDEIARLQREKAKLDRPREERVQQAPGAAEAATAAEERADAEKQEAAERRGAQQRGARQEAEARKGAEGGRKGGG